MNAGIYDASGRYIAPPQSTVQERPGGPWSGNRATDQAASVRRSSVA